MDPHQKGERERMQLEREQRSGSADFPIPEVDNQHLYDSARNQPLNLHPAVPWNSPLHDHWSYGGHHHHFPQGAARKQTSSHLEWSSVIHFSLDLPCTDKTHSSTDCVHAPEVAPLLLLTGLPSTSSSGLTLHISNEVGALLLSKSDRNLLPGHLWSSATVKTCALVSTHDTGETNTRRASPL